MKKTFLTMVLALVLGLGANAQNRVFDWDEAEDYYSFDASNIGMFDWDVFTDLFDMNNSVGVIGDWAADFGGTKDGIEIGFPIHELSGSQDGAPLGSGIAVLVGLGAAYAFAKRRKED